MDTVSLNARSRDIVGLIRRLGRLLRWRLVSLSSLARRDPRRIPTPPWLPPAEARPAVPELDNEPLPSPLIYGELKPVAADLEVPETGGLPAEPTVSHADDVLLVPAHLFVDRRSGRVLPQSFDVAVPGFARSGLDSRPPRLGGAPNAGEAFVLDCHYNSGFGHMLLEMAPRLMLRDLAPPDIPIATSAPRSPMLTALVRGMGHDPERLLHFDHGVLCDRAWFPDPLVRLDRSFHPLAWEAFDRLKQLGREASVERVERLFISRAGITRRRLGNEAEIEALFADRGFRIVRPELLPLADQIALFAGAKCIAGLGGSAMHSAVFAAPDAQVLLISSVAWFVWTDVVISQRAGRLGYVFGPAGQRRGPDDGSSDWSVDANVVQAAIARHFGL